MNQFLDLVFLLLMQPRTGMRLLINEKRYKESGMIWLFTVFLLTIATVIKGPGMILEFAGMILIFGTGLIFHSAIIDYLAGMTGGNGSARGITAAFMASYIPLGFSVFFMLLANMGYHWLAGLGSFILGIWSFVLEILAISENYHVSTLKAMGISLLPYLFLTVLVVTFIALGVAAALSALTDMQGMEHVIQSL